ncbi:hypothetical protein B4P00_04250 [Shewanella xiamenensis]|uniref:Nmad2 family putative nucleotide modification protein n=1 Tax=Shewanella xiamenensis TaxID=332186 RepID=UPI001C4E00AC|nr:hypothetical protein [Shewanella xiamenensis]MBW0295461.1 hypothetical protein [Shewanella xiamenensis]
MLINQGASLFVYPIPRDLGFAPNPFHGYCTLATCKPKLRKSAKVNDWVMGLAASNVKDKKYHCIFLMKVTEKLTFQEYWADPRFELKKPIRNGSKVQVLGDNIYHKNSEGKWIQEDSHHSNSDGTINEDNLKRDTGSTHDVLVSECYTYFGSEAKQLDLNALGYQPIRDYRKLSLDNQLYARDYIEKTIVRSDYRNMVIGDPIHFNLFDKRVDQTSGKYA